MVIAAKVNPESIVLVHAAEDDDFARYIGYRDSTLGEYAVNPCYDVTCTELLTIRAIEPAGAAEVFDVSVQFDESFVANGFVLP